MLKISNFKYLVVKTGYTGRLVKKLAELKELLTEHLEDDDPILYIEDSIWGGGLFTVTEKQEEIDRIQKVYPNVSGVIVLRCESLVRAMGAVEILMGQRYCAFFSFGTLYQMELIDEEILVMSFDCESG